MNRITESSQLSGLRPTAIEEWCEKIIGSFRNLNALSMNINELGEDVRIPANQIATFMDTSSRIFRLIPVILTTLDKLDSRLINLDRNVGLLQAEVRALRTNIAPPNITTPDIAIPLNNAPVPVRYREESSLSNRSISSIFNSWFIENLHSCIPEKGEGKSRLKEIAILIFYAKRFLASNTTIEAKPIGNENLNQLIIWQQSVNSMSSHVESEIVTFLESHRSSWMKKSSDDAPVISRRKITGNFYACIKKLKSISIDLYPNPNNVLDLATTRGEFFVKEPALAQGIIHNNNNNRSSSTTNSSGSNISSYFRNDTNLSRSSNTNTDMLTTSSTNNNNNKKRSRVDMN